MNKTIKPGRLAGMIAFFLAFLVIYLVFLYKLQIVEGEEYYNRSSETKTVERDVTAARGNILDCYGRTLVSNKECYNLKIDTNKLFANEDPNAVILELVDLVESYGDKYTDDLPISAAPPFIYDPDMSDIERTMLKSYFKDKKESIKQAGLPPEPSAVELMSYMRKRYDIDNSYSAEQMRIIAGVRYSINVRYAINTADYIFVEDASMQLITSIMERKLVGIQVERAYVRDYATEYASHILGYVGLMTQEEFEKYSLQDYANNAMVGKDGVEYAFEKYLHGKDGKVMETRTPTGTILSTKYVEEPKPGNHVYLTLDLALQEQVERILDNGVNLLISNREQQRAEEKLKGQFNPELKDEITGASAVVINVKNGAPLAIASWPSYKVSTIMEDYQELMKAPNTPLFNRALMGAYAPGSTFKPCTAMAALSTGQINTEYRVKCDGVFTKYAADGYAPECWIWNVKKGEHLTHPDENVVTAIRDSCNFFFYTISDTMGVDTMEQYAHDFGLGVSTGIELVETTGNMSNQRNHADYTGQPWRIGDTLQAGIGQSDSIFSPLQIGEYAATIANGGKRYSASILKSVRSFDFSEKIYEREPEVLSEVKSADYNWAAVHEGMHEVLNNWVNPTNAEIWTKCEWICAGKTGTAQKGENITNDGIFICYGPYSDPEIAIAVVVERGHAGADVQFIAKQIMDAYINIRKYSDDSEPEMALLK